MAGHCREMIKAMGDGLHEGEREEPRDEAPHEEEREKVAVLVV